MANKQLASTAHACAATRLAQLAPLDADDLLALSSAGMDTRRFAAHREIVAEGRAVTGRSVVLSGWACRSRIFADGRRQILSLLLPGDLIGVCRQTDPIAATGVTALTDVVVGAVPHADADRGNLTEAYARSGALEEFYLFRQIGRIGRFSAYERIIDLLLELRERLASVDLAQSDSFPLPITQEILADTLGLTAVHVNRMLQSLRREGFLDLRGGVAYLSNVEQLAKLVDYRPATVFAH